MLFLFPDFASVKITSISMLAVLANSISGSIASHRHQRIHWRAGLLFSLAALPGIVVGLELAKRIEREGFELAFGFLLFLVACFLFYRTFKKAPTERHPTSKLSTRAMIHGFWVCMLAGVLSSFLGIGGGVIYVPMLSQFMHFPVLLATGTSQLILALTSAVTSVGHWQNGQYADLPDFVPYLLVGIFCGAQVGAKLAKKISSKRILQILAVVLMIIAGRLVLR